MQPAVATVTPDRSRGSLLDAPERVDLDSIAQHFVKLSGGPGSIAKMLHDEYVAAGEGSPVRARIMEMMLRAFTKLDAKAIPDDLRDVSDADLERVLDQIASRVSGKPNGHQRPAAAPATVVQEEADVRKETQVKAGGEDATAAD